MRPLLIALLGGWVLGTMLIAFVAMQHFHRDERARVAQSLQRLDRACEAAPAA